MFKRSIACLICLISLCACLTAHAQGAEDSYKLFPVVQGGKWGYIDRSGKIIIKPQFDGAYPFYEGIAKVMMGRRLTNEKWSYIDTTGKSIHKDLAANRIEHFSEGLGAVCLYKQDEVGYLCGYMDKTGSWALEPKFYSSMSFQDGLARTAIRDRTSKTGTREVYIDKTGNVAIDLSSLQTNSGEGFSDGLARIAVSVKGKEYLPQGFIDKTGKIVIEPKFEAVADFSEGRAAVMFFKYLKNQDPNADEPFSAGFIDQTGEIVIKPQFDFFQPFSEGLSFVMMSGKMGAIDKTGKVVIRPQFVLPKANRNPYGRLPDNYPEASHWSFSEGLAAVNKLGLWGYVDRTGKLVIPARFSEAHKFSNGLALVMVGDRVGYIDKSGKYVWKPTR